MDAAEYKKEREKLYDKAAKLYNSAQREEGGARANAEKFYREFMADHGLDERIVLNIAKYKEVKPGRTFKFDGMEFVTFDEFRKYYEANKGSMGFWKRVQLLKQLFFENGGKKTN